MIQLLVALVDNNATVLAFDEVDKVRGIGIVNLSDEDDQSVRDELDTELQVLLGRGEILGWGTKDTLFTMEGDDQTTYTLDDMVETNRDQETGEDWITVELLSIPRAKPCSSGCRTPLAWPDYPSGRPRGACAPNRTRGSAPLNFVSCLSRSQPLETTMPHIWLILPLFALISSVLFLLLFDRVSAALSARRVECCDRLTRSIIDPNGNRVRFQRGHLPCAPAQS